MHYEGIPQHSDAITLDGEPCPLATLFPGEQAGLGEQREMVAHGGLAAIEHLRKVTAAHRSIRSVRDEAQYPKPNRVREEFEAIGEFFSLMGLDRFNENRFTTRGDELHEEIIPLY